MIDAIRNEHARVYMQDQALLNTIKEHVTSASKTNKSNKEGDENKLPS